MGDPLPKVCQTVSEVLSDYIDLMDSCRVSFGNLWKIDQSGH